MNRRGRPKHPDVLTPREWEVLELIREGLSNEEIGRRLGISIDGVKFHVSEILSKLGLENRHDAARWRPGALAPLLFWRRLSLDWLSPALAGVLAVGMLAGVGVLVWALLATRGEGEPVGVAGLTVENFGQRLLDSLEREDQVFHTTIEEIVVSSTGEAQRAFSAEVWWGANEGVGREEFRKDPSYDADIGDFQESIALGGTIHNTDGFEVWTSTLKDCPPGLTPIFGSALSLLLPCEPYPEDQGPYLTPHIDLNTSYEGSPAFALVLEGRAEEEGLEGREVTDITSTYYVERDRFLPLAFVSEYRQIQPEQQDGKIIVSFDSDFIPRDSLSADFFDPVSIGYVAPTPTNPNPAHALDQPDLGMAVYWVGRELPGAGSLPPLLLISSEGGDPPDEGPGFRASLLYEQGSGGEQVDIWLWRADDWQTFYDGVIPSTPFASRCAQQEQIELEAGSAVIYMSHEPPRPSRPATPEAVIPRRPDATIAPYVTPTPAVLPAPTDELDESGCPARPFDLFFAVVSYEDTVVTVNAPLCILCVGRGVEPDPYDSREGMEAIVRGLRLRQTGE